MKAMILIPTYNEASTVVELINALKALRDSGQYNFDVTVIDDNSPDKTAEIVESLAGQRTRLGSAHFRFWQGSHSFSQHLLKAPILIFFLSLFQLSQP